MPSIKRRPGVPALRGFAIAAAVVAVTGVTGSSLQATPEHPGGAGTHPSTARDLFRNCSSGERDTKRFEVERAGARVRTIEFCDAQDRGDRSATAQALSVAIDSAPPLSRITSDPRMLEILSLRLTRARTEMNTRLDADDRSRKITEIDDAIKALEDKISRDR